MARLFTLPFAVMWSQIFAIVATWLITGLNYLGMRKAGDFQLVFTWLKGVLIVAIAGICFGSMAGHWGNFATKFVGAHGGFGGFMIALIAALWAYDGWNDLTMVAGEVRNPERSLPIALIAGLGIVGVLYMATNAAIQYILPAAQIAASPRPAVTALAAITGPWGAGLVSIAMAVSIFVTLNGTIMSGARVPFAAARDGLFFRRMADIHPRFASPSTSLIVQALLTTGLLLAVGRFQQLFELAIFAEWLFYMITATTIFFYRRRETRREDLPRLGLPGGSRALRRGGRGAAGLLLRGEPEEFADRHRDHRHSALHSSRSSAEIARRPKRPRSAQELFYHRSE